MSAPHPADELQRRPLYRTEYEALGRLGMFDDEKVELLDGEVVYAAEEGPPHAAVCARLARILFDAIPASEGEIRVGNPFALSERSLPEPDFLVARGGRWTWLADRRCERTPGRGKQPPGCQLCLRPGPVWAGIDERGHDEPRRDCTPVATAVSRCHSAVDSAHVAVRDFLLLADHRGRGWSRERLTSVCWGRSPVVRAAHRRPAWGCATWERSPAWAGRRSTLNSTEVGDADRHSGAGTNGRRAVRQASARRPRRRRLRP